MLLKFNFLYLTLFLLLVFSFSCDCEIYVLLKAKVTQVKQRNTCSTAGDYACFNNGTCLNDVSSEDGYSCQCLPFFTGKRCELFDPCLNNPCSPHSKCLPIVDNNDQMSYECKCDKGYLGRNCTIKFEETCLASPCLNGATCLNVTSQEEEGYSQKLTYECMCLAGYEGKNCEKLIDYCKLYEPCQNGGSCMNTLHNQSYYKCICPKGWKGINCTLDVDECALIKSRGKTACSGNGQCINTKGSYKCQCNEYHYGNNCEHTHICQHEQYEMRPCQNGAICLIAGERISDNKYECKCSFGYAGQNCSYITCDLQPCKHDTICQMQNQTHYDCNCTGSGFIGANCETLIDEVECKLNACFGNYTCDPTRCECSRINCENAISKHMKARQKDFVYQYILWPLIAVILAFALIVVLVLIMKVKKSRSTRGTYRPSREEKQETRIDFNLNLEPPHEERLI